MIERDQLIRSSAFLAGALVGEALTAVLWPVPDLIDHDPSGSVGAGEPPLRMVVLGDSSCTGTGVDDPGQIWLRLLAHRIAVRVERRVDIDSYAEGGARSREVVESQLAHALAHPAPLAVLSVGANDVLRGTPLPALASNLGTIVAQLTARGTTVVMSGVGDLGTIPRLAPPLRQMVARRARRADLVHADVAAEFGAIKAFQWGWARREFATRPEVWSGDRFHPNGRGHEVWAETAWRAIEPVLPRFRAGSPALDRKG